MKRGKKQVTQPITAFLLTLSSPKIFYMTVVLWYTVCNIKFSLVYLTETYINIGAVLSNHAQVPDAFSAYSKMLISNIHPRKALKSLS